MSDTGPPPKASSDFEAKLDQADMSVAAFDQDKPGPLQILRGFLHTNPTAIPAFVLALSIIGFGITAPRFFSAHALSLVLEQVTVTGVVAVAQTMIILTAGIDLSVGAIMMLSSVVMGKLAVSAGLPAPLAILVGIGVGGVMGYLNALLVTYIRLPPFIVTLGTLKIFSTLKLWYSGSVSIRASDVDAQAPFLTYFGQEAFSLFGGSVTYGGVALILLTALVWYLLNRTAWGRHVHAVGDDPDAALLAGIQTQRVLRSVYIFAGLICGFAAWVLIGRVGSVSPLGGETMNLDSITAVVIGGTSLFGGRGSIVGSVLGALIVGVFNTGLSLAGVDDYWQEFAIGILLLGAVAMDQWLRRAVQ